MAPTSPMRWAVIPCDESRRGIGHVREHNVGADVRVCEALEDLGGTALGHLRRPVHREVLEQAPLVRRGRRDREGDAWVSAEIPQLPLIRQCRQDDLIPTQAGVTCSPPSLSIVTTCATAPRSNRVTRVWYPTGEKPQLTR